VEEFQEALVLRAQGETVDGRLYKEAPNGTWMFIPSVAALLTLGKAEWLREMLLDPSGVEELVKGVHEYFEGSCI